MSLFCWQDDSGRIFKVGNWSENASWQSRSLLGGHVSRAWKTFMQYDKESKLVVTYRYGVKVAEKKLK